MRSIHALDLSPRALNCILAGTPRVDLSYTAAFVQRHLASSNWAKATPLRYGDTMSSYTMEYHFSFYYVTPTVGANFALIAYVTVALGGFGSLFGALIAGLLIGEVEALTALLIEPSLKQVGMFAIYLAVLMFRPRGLFGRL